MVVFTLGCSRLGCQLGARLVQICSRTLLARPAPARARNFSRTRRGVIPNCKLGQSSRRSVWLPQERHCCRVRQPRRSLNPEQRKVHNSSYMLSRDRQVGEVLAGFLGDAGQLSQPPFSRCGLINPSRNRVYNEVEGTSVDDRLHVEVADPPLTLQSRPAYRRHLRQCRPQFLHPRRVWGHRQ